MSTSFFFWNIVLGAIGFGYFVYGRKQKAIAPMLCGAALMAFPYFISNTVLLIVVGMVLVAAPFLFRS